MTSYINWAGTGMQTNEEKKAKANNLNQMYLIIE